MEECEKIIILEDYMQKLSIHAKISPDVKIEDLKNFNWKYYDSDKGVYLTNGIVTILTKTREITYPKLTQEVLDWILLKCCEGKIIIMRDTGEVQKL